MTEHGSITQGLSLRRKAYDITMPQLTYVPSANLHTLHQYPTAILLYH